MQQQHSLGLQPAHAYPSHYHARPRVRAYLHLVLCFSPAEDSFRQRLRMFPSLVNCTTIDWFRCGAAALC